MLLVCIQIFGATNVEIIKINRKQINKNNLVEESDKKQEYLFVLFLDR